LLSIQLLFGVKTLVDWCHVFLPDAVPERQIFTEMSTAGLRQIENRFYPDEILQAVNEALKSRIILT
jgi:hypothetical protein